MCYVSFHKNLSLDRQVKVALSEGGSVSLFLMSCIKDLLKYAALFMCK